MNSLALLLLVISAASALPRPQQGFQPQPFTQGVAPRRVPALTYRVYQADPDGQFHSSVVQDDQQQHEESGKLVINDLGDGYVLEKTGKYSYISPEGKLIQISYTADKNGFHPVGDAIPVAPVPGATF